MNLEQDSIPSQLESTPQEESMDQRKWRLAKELKVFKDVILYVEVRSTSVNTNCSVDVGNVMAKAGAPINPRLWRNTTHVVFKDGFYSTYKKAKAWNIPIVKILWFNDCVEKQRLSDPKLYVIDNACQYDNPAKYGKIMPWRCIETRTEIGPRMTNQRTAKKRAALDDSAESPPTELVKGKSEAHFSGAGAANGSGDAQPKAQKSLKLNEMVGPSGSTVKPVPVPQPLSESRSFLMAANLRTNGASLNLVNSIMAPANAVRTQPLELDIGYASLEEDDDIIDLTAD